MATPALGTRETLIRLKRWLGRERGRYIRGFNETQNPTQKERYYGEINVCTTTMHRIDKLIAELTSEKRSKT